VLRRKPCSLAQAAAAMSDGTGKPLSAAAKRAAARRARILAKGESRMSYVTAGRGASPPPLPPILSLCLHGSHPRRAFRRQS
jgi:hypothetical protein